MSLLTAAAFAAAAGVAAGSPSYRAFGPLGLAALLAVPPIVVAFLVERRRSTSWLGPMLALTGFLPSLALLGDIFKHGPLGDYAVALSQGSWVLLYLSAALLVLFFPEGRLRGRDRLLSGVIVADALLFIAVGAMWPEPYPAPYKHSPHVFGTVPHGLAVAIVAITLPGVLVTLVLTVGSLVLRYRRSGAELRAQMRWLALVGMLLPLTLLAAWAGYVTVHIGDPIVLAGLALAYLAIPAVIGIAILRPDLFDVNRVLASTATHAAGTTAVPRDLHRRQPGRRPAPAGQLRPRRRRGDLVVRAPARAAPGTAPTPHRPLALPGPPSRSRRDRGVDPANCDDSGTAGAAGDRVATALGDPTLRVGLLA